MTKIERYKVMLKNQRPAERSTLLHGRIGTAREFGAKLRGWGWRRDEALVHCRMLEMDELEFELGFDGVPPCVHFVGFRGNEWHSALRIFGPPDFIHRVWDERVIGDVAPGDTVVFAKGDETFRKTPYTFNDSEHF